MKEKRRRERRTSTREKVGGGELDSATPCSSLKLVLKFNNNYDGFFTNTTKYFLSIDPFLFE